MSYSLLGLDEEPAAKKKAVAKAPSKYSALGLDDSTAPAPAPVSKVPNDTGASLVINPKTASTNSLVSKIDFSKYNTVAAPKVEEKKSFIQKGIQQQIDFFKNNPDKVKKENSVLPYKDTQGNLQQGTLLRTIGTGFIQGLTSLPKGIDDIIDLVKGKQLNADNWTERLANTGNKYAELSNAQYGDQGGFVSQLGSGIGQMGSFLIPSTGAGKAAGAVEASTNILGKLAGVFSKSEKIVENVSKYAPQLAKWTAQGTMVGQEAAMEMGQAYDDTLAKNNGDVKKANESARNVFLANAAFIAATNKFSGFFEEMPSGAKNAVKKVLAAFIGEGGQEAGQQIISNNATGKKWYDGVKDSFLIGGIIGSGTTLATANIFKEDKNGEPTDEIDLNKVKDVIATTQAAKLEVEDLQREGKTDQEIIDALVAEKGIDQGTAQAVMDTVKNSNVLLDSQEDINPQAHEALKQDVADMLQNGESVSEISEKIQSILGFPATYADSLVAQSLVDLQNVPTSENINTEVKPNEQQKIEEKSYSNVEIAQKLADAGVAIDTVEKLAKNLAVALNKAGTDAEIAASIAMLSNPSNESSRAIYEAETGTKLPATAQESKKVLTNLLKPSSSREYAKNVVSAQIKGEKTYKSKKVSSETSDSNLPDYIPDELRSKKMLSDVEPYLEKGVRPTDEKLGKLYDLIQSEIDTVEEKYKEEEINLNENNVSAESSSIPFDVANAQITSESLITMGEAETIIRNYFEADEVPLSFVKNLRTPRGLDAWGKYSKQVITLIENPRADTPHHEAVHAFLDLFVPEYERSRFLATAYADQVSRLGFEKVKEQLKDLELRYNGKLSSEQIKSIYSEEALADGFYEYLQGRNQKSPLAKFYDMVIAFVKSLKDEADSMRLYEEIIAKKRYTEERMKEAMKIASRITYAQEKGLDPSLFSIKNRIHPEDVAVLQKFIDHARLKTELSDAEYKAAERLAEKWGISMDKGIAGVANEFVKILENGKKVTSTILYSEKQDNAKNILGSEIKNFKSSDEFVSKFKDISEKVSKYAGGDRAKFNENISSEEQDLRSKVLAYLQTPEVEKMYVDGKKDPEILKNFYEENTKEPETVSMVKSRTYATQPFKNLENKNKAFKSATNENTESHAINLGEEKIKVEGAKIQKAKGEIDGLYTSPYTVIIQKNAKERVIFSAESEEEATAWLKKNGGKSVSVDNNQTSSVMVDGNEAHAIVTSPAIIPMETENIAGTTEAKKITFYDTTGKKLATAEVTQEGSDFEPLAVVSQETPATLESYKEAIKDNSPKAVFPSYFAAINGQPVLISSDSVPVSQETYTRAKKEQVVQNPVEPNLNTDEKIRKSGAFQNAKERLGEDFQEDVNYTAIKIEDQISKAFNLLDADPEYAKAVALGFAQPPLDITDTAISIAVAERAKETGDYALQAEAEKARSLRQTRRGQELVLEKGYVDESSSHFFIDKVIKRRKELVEQKYKPILGKSTPFMEILHEKTSVAKKKAVKKLKEDLELKVEQFDSILEELVC